MSQEVSISDEKTILEIEHATFEAIRLKDAGALSRILSDDFIYRSPQGGDANKDEFIKIATGLPVAILAVWGENLLVNFYGETAVLTGVQHARVETEDGKEAVSSVAFADVFVREEGGWRMTLAFGVELRTAPADNQS